MKIGQYLAKIWTRVQCAVFLGHPVVLLTADVLIYPFQGIIENIKRKKLTQAEHIDRSASMPIGLKSYCSDTDKPRQTIAILGPL